MIIAQLPRHVGCGLLTTLLILTIPAVTAAGAAAKPPRARAVDFDEKIIFRSPENPGFAAWVQLWQQPDGDLMTKFLLRRKPAAGEHIPPRAPLDVHRWDAIGLPVTYDFADLVTETVTMRSCDAGATWTESLRSTEIELNSAADSGCMSPIALPDGRLLSLSWGMPGCLRESTDGGKTWRPLHDLMDPAYYDVAPFTIRLLSDKKTLVIFCPYTRPGAKAKPRPAGSITVPAVVRRGRLPFSFPATSAKP